MPVQRFADLSIDLEAAMVRRGSDILPVTDRSFDLLRELVSQAPDVVSHRELFDTIWPGQVVSPETLKQRVRLLRQALGQAPGPVEYVVSVHGRGYRLGYPVEQCAESESQGRRWIRIIVAALAAALAAWFVSWLLRDDSPPPPAASASVEAQPAEAPPAPKPDVDEEPP